MSITALTTFIRIQNKAEKTRLRIQNGAEGQVKLDGTDYDYLGFVYSGSAVNLTGDNLDVFGVVLELACVGPCGKGGDEQLARACDHLRDEGV